MALSSRLRLLGTSAVLGLVLAGVTAQGSAAQERTYAFEIPSEPLSRALRDFGVATHQQLMFTEGLTAGKAAPAVKGDLEAEAALSQILAGSGLSARRTPMGAWVIERGRDVGQAPKENSPPEGVKVSEVEGVVVTASRVERRGFTAPTPTTILSAKAIEQQGFTNLANALVQIPAARGSVLPTTGAGMLSFFGSYINLRNLGANRTLVLVDGSRVVSSTNTGTVDLNLIPTIAVDRIDVVTGGASAAYGSEAVAGVVNLALKSRFNGLQMDAQYGETKYQDSRNTRLAVLAGAPIFGDRGHVLAALDYDDNTGIGNLTSRPWAKRSLGAITGAAGKVYIVPDLQSSVNAPGGLIIGGPLAYTAFGPGGVPFALQLGDTFGNPKSNVMAGGGNTLVTGSETSPLAQPQSHFSLLGRVDYALSNTLHGAVTVNYGDSASNHASVYNRPTFTIPLDNAFLPAPTRAAMIANGLKSISLASAGGNTPSYRVDSHNKTYRIVAALDGELAHDWGWDAHFEYGKNSFENSVLNNIIPTRQALAVDAVVNPANGQIVCRSTLTNPSNGCAPLNLFGQGSGSAAAIKYVTGVSTLFQDTFQRELAVNVHGSLFSTWAGPISVAAGYEARRDWISATSDPLSQANIFAVYNPKPMSGAIDVNEGYVEAVIPLLKDQPFAEALDFDGAVRYADYSTSGGATTWKAGLVYQVSDQLRIRTSLSRDIRAPNLSDVFTGGQTAINTITYRGNSQPVLALTKGNKDLTPEISKTFSAGAIYSPSWLPGFTGSIDYYDINVSNAIATITAQLIINRCLQGDQVYCALVTFDSAQNIQLINISSLNLNTIRTSGIDLNASYAFPLDRLKEALPGRLEVSALGNYLRRMTTTDSSGTIDRVGEIGSGIFLPGLNGPRWVWDGNIHYSAGPLGLNAHFRHISGGVIDVNGTPQNLSVNSVESRNYWNVGGDYIVKKIGSDGNAQVYGGVNNVFNVSPPSNLTNGSAGNASNYYNIAGRFYYVGFRMRL